MKIGTSASRIEWLCLWEVLSSLGRRVAVVALFDALVLELHEGVEDARAGVGRLIREDRAVDGAAGARDGKIDRSRSHDCPSVRLCGSMPCTVCAVSRLPLLFSWTAPGELLLLNKRCAISAPPQVGKLASFDNRT